MTKNLKQQEHCYILGENEPTLKVESGETVIVETADNINNRIVKGGESKEILPTLKEWNPLSGPIFVEDAFPGDTLVVIIEEIESIYDRGWGGQMPDAVFSSGKKLHLLHEPIPYTVNICPIENSTIKIPLKNKEDISVKSDPFIGTIGVAPEADSASSVKCGKYGGNMDSPDVCPGNKLFLPVNVEGAYLSLGDVHALQGDGELAGAPVEIASRCKLTIDVINNKGLDWPRIESSDYIMTVGNCNTLNNSVRTAATEMIYWLRDEYDFDLEDAAFLSSTIFEIQVNQVIGEPNTSVSVKFPKKYLP